MYKYSYRNIFDGYKTLVGYTILRDGEICLGSGNKFFIVYNTTDAVLEAIKELNTVTFSMLEVGEKFILEDMYPRTLVKISPVDLGYGNKTNAITHLSGNSNACQHRCYCVPDDMKVERAE